MNPLNKLFYLSLIIIFFTQKAFAFNYKVDDLVNEKFFINKKVSFELPKGKWVVAEKKRYNAYTMNFKEYTLLRLEGNKAIEGIIIAEALTAGFRELSVNQAIYEALFKNEYQGCYERPEYTFVNVYRKGSTHNCLVVEHTDIQRDIYNPKDPSNQTSFTELKSWLDKNNINLPKIALASTHSYFSRLAGGKWYVVQYATDPKVLSGPKNKFITVETSEYHPSKINNYPEHKKIMNEWLRLSKLRHKKFENSIKSLKKHSIISSDTDLTGQKKTEKSVVNQLKELNELFKSGVLTKEEFEKAKNKILK